MTSDLTDSGTNKRLGGQPAGGVTPCKALLTFDSTSHTSVETNRLSGKMHSGVDGRSERSKIRDKASGLTFLEPGRYERTKFKTSEKKCPPSLPGVQSFSSLNVFQVLVVGPDDKRYP